MKADSHEIPINDLRRHTESIRKELDKALSRVLTRGWYCLGPEVAAFEKEFADYCGTRFCVAVNSGTDALELALRALGVAPGDKVLTVANAGCYASTAILAIGAWPVYIDVNPTTLNMDPELLAELITSDTKAVIITHLYGRLAEIEELVHIAKSRHIPLVEDCAQAHGAERNGKKAGSFGDFGCFSFYPTKNLGALGDSGAVVTNSKSLKERLDRLRQYGWATKYHFIEKGGRNSRMDEMQAAVLRVKLPYLDGWNRRRREIAMMYAERLSTIKAITVPENYGPDNVAHLFVIRCRDREQLRSGLKELGIATDIHYPLPDYKQPIMAGNSSPVNDLPITEELCSEVVSLPCFPEMGDDEVDRVINTVTNILQ